MQRLCETSGRRPRVVDIASTRHMVGTGLILGGRASGAQV
jgi:hypothetical protein